MMINQQGVSLLGLLATVFSLNLACTAGNPGFCDTSEDCGSGQECLGGACEFSLTAPDSGPASDDAGATDAETATTCADVTQVCLETPPTGWSGPALQFEQAPGQSASCPSAFDAEQLVGFVGIQAGGSCGCSCGDTTSFTCQDGAIEGRDGPIDFGTCFGDCVFGDCVSQKLSSGVCSSISSSVRSQEVLRLNEGIVTGGSCGLGINSSNLEPPSFDTQVLLCVADISPNFCPEGSVCATTPPPAFDASTCIFQEGEHACPSDTIYQERRVIFADIDDQRSCDSCDCEPSTGGPCGSVEVFNDDPSCSGAPIDTVGICTTMPNLVSPRAKFTRRQSVSCRGPVDPPISGSAVGVGATTVCCAP